MRPTLSSTGYVVDSLQAALFFGLTADSIEDAVVQAVNNGEDTDTVGAMTGALAGARFGVDAVPARWSREVDESARLETLAAHLVDLRGATPGHEYVGLVDGTLRFAGGGE